MFYDGNEDVKTSLGLTVRAIWTSLIAVHFLQSADLLVSCGCHNCSLFKSLLDTHDGKPLRIKVSDDFIKEFMRVLISGGRNRV
jgi:hypothetical protein